MRALAGAASRRTVLLTDRWLIIRCFQVAHPDIRDQLVGYIYNGFLVPVLAPALHKVFIALSPPVKPPVMTCGQVSREQSSGRSWSLEARFSGTQLIVLNEICQLPKILSLFNL